MLEVNIVIALVLGLVIGVLFLLTEFYHEKYCFECKGPKSKEKQVSIIAGFSIAYFFLKLLPEIFQELSQYNQEIFTYSAIFVGFCFIHLSEKMILKRVGNQCRTIIKDLVIKKKQLEIEGKITERKLNVELEREKWDKLTVRKLAETISGLNQQDKELKEHEKEIKMELESHLNKDLEKVHVAINYFYHLIVGLIIFNLLKEDLFSGILFSFFAILKATISNTSNRHIKIFDINIHTKIEEHNFIKILSITSVLTGVAIGLILELIYPLSSFVIFQCFAFISGIILYIVVREVIPQEEKGRPYYFISGATIFIIILIFIEILSTYILIG
jgi:zinc transporter ZupT